MTFTIRPARVDETTALEDLQRRASLGWDEYREQLLAHPDAIDLPVEQVRAGRVRVAHDGAHVLGFSVLLPPSAGVWELDGLFVEPAYQHGGVGRGLLAEMVERARAEGARAIEVTAGPATGFYEALGFVAGEAVPTRFGPAVRLRLDLA